MNSNGINEFQWWVWWWQQLHQVALSTTSGLPISPPVRAGLDLAVLDEQ
jgi:hypothetical protein